MTKIESYLIAEISGNHSGSLERALNIIDLASKANCDALKFQSFDHKLMTLNIDRKDFMVIDKNSPWNNEHLFALYKRSQIPYEWYPEIFNRAKKNKIACFSSVFDIKSLEILEKYDPPAYKIASCEIGYLDLIEKIAETKKPILISTGMATLNEIEKVMELLGKKI